MIPVPMNLLLIGDGSRYIDLSAAQKFRMRDATYYRSQDGIWARCQHPHARRPWRVPDRKEACSPSGQALTEREAFMAFMRERKFTEAQEYFKKLFDDGAKAGAVVESDTHSPGEKPRARLRLRRFMFAGFIGLLLAAYVAAILSGTISASRQITIADLIVVVIAVIAIGIVIWPESLRNIQELGIGGLSVKMRSQMRDLLDTQRNHQKQLDQLRFTLYLLVTDNERTHLENLYNRTTANYKRNEWLQAELRRLRTIGLITSKRFIFEMPEEFDLGDWVALTERGDEYLRRWTELNT
jgi:hypothetical protein